ncbi:protein kinase [Streptomyces scopuliridis]|uniref:protein kinase domain-containing protein n=1 Tax=Streptomyces scopuliridis TaxID=452529 RepID=UPI003677B5BA
MPTFSGTAPALREAVSMLCNVAKTLADLKGRGIVHGDLKPENILLLVGRWCLVGFGISRHAEAATAKLIFKLAGIFTYMASERWDIQRAATASDIYALGILVHQLLEGSNLFTGPADVDFAEQHLRGTWPLLATAPPLLAALVAECLFKGISGVALFRGSVRLVLLRAAVRSPDAFRITIRMGFTLRRQGS